MGKLQSILKRSRGFTLVEVIIVLLILAILGGMMAPALTGYITEAKARKSIVEARQYRQTVVTMQTMIFGESNMPLWNIKRVRTYYLMPSNTQIGGSYKIMHVTCEGTDPIGTRKWKELTGKQLKSRYLNDIRTSSFPGYFVINSNSEIVAGWLISEDTNSLITWGIKERDERTFYNSTNLVQSNSPETLTSSDIDPNVNYVVYKRKPGTKVFELI